MPDTAPGSRGRDRQKIPRIEAEEAARIYERCAGLEEDVSGPLTSLRRVGFDKFISQLEERILQLAVQPDSWGERTRARLISEIIANLLGIPVSSLPVADVTKISNVLIPCFLLELGRRREHVQVEFPANPCEPDARFSFKAGLSHPNHTITATQLIHLATDKGEQLVGLCYFGDQPCRIAIEAGLAFESAARDHETGPTH